MLREVQVKELRVERKIHLVYPSHRTLSHAARAFLALLDDRPGLPPPALGVSYDGQEPWCASACDVALALSSSSPRRRSRARRRPARADAALVSAYDPGPARQAAHHEGASTAAPRELVLDEDFLREAAALRAAQPAASWRPQGGVAQHRRGGDRRGERRDR